MNHFVTPLRWTARIWSVASLLFVLLMVAGTIGVGGKQLRPHEWVGLAMFPFGVSVGLIAAFRKERLGGAITVASLAGFYVWHYVVAGDLPGGPYFVILAAPGALRLICVGLADTGSDQGGTVSDNNGEVTINNLTVATHDRTTAGLQSRKAELTAATEACSRIAIVVTSMHHDNTLKTARVMAAELKAVLFTPEQAFAEDLNKYDLVGFGSGIYFGQHHRALIRMVRSYSRVPQDVFIFSTAGLPWLSRWFHWPLRRVLLKRGCRIAAEFSCRGWDNVGPLFFIGGINRQHPDARDLNRAVSFARQLVNAK